MEHGEQPAVDVTDLGDVPLEGPDGVVWSIAAGYELNANLVRLSPGGGVGAHVNDEVDVLVVVLAGTGTLRVDGTAASLDADRVAVVPRGARREIAAGAAGLLYLTVHRQRGPLRISRR